MPTHTFKASNYQTKTNLSHSGALACTTVGSVLLSVRKDRI